MSFLRKARPAPKNFPGILNFSIEQPVHKSEGFHGNVLKIEVAAGDFSNSGFDIFYKLYNLTTMKDLAYAKTGMVCFDYKERKIKETPKEFIKKII